MTTNTCSQGHEHTVTVERKVVGHAYARSGNAHNPTPRVMFTAFVDGKPVCSNSRRSYAVEVAEAYIANGEVDAQ